MLHHTEPQHITDINDTNHCKTKHLGKEEILGQSRTQTEPEQNPNRVLHSKCVICVSHLDWAEDLWDVVNAWSYLPEPIRAAILAIVKSVKAKRD